MVKIFSGQYYTLVDALTPVPYTDYAKLYQGGIGLVMGQTGRIVPIPIFKAMKEVAGENLGTRDSGRGGLMKIAKDVKGVWNELMLTSSSMIDVLMTIFPEEKTDNSILRQQLIQNLENMVEALQEHNPYMKDSEVVELGEVGIVRLFSYESQDEVRLKRVDEGWIWKIAEERDLHLSDLEVYSACCAVENFENAWINAFGSQIVRNGILQSQGQVNH